MSVQMDRVLYTPWFKQELVKLLGPAVDLTNIRLCWDAGCYWMKPGKHKKHIMLAFEYKNRKLLLEQDDKYDMYGVVRDCVD